MIEIPFYRYRVTGGDIKDPSTQGYTEGTFEKISTRSDLEDLSDSLRSYTLLGPAGVYELDGRWKEIPEGYTNGETVVHDFDAFEAYLPSEGVNRQEVA